MSAMPALFGEPWLAAVLLALAGFAAGVINTMAGGGSLLTIPLLMLVGLPIHVANGTNRVAVLLQNASAFATFHVRGTRDYGVVWKLAVPMGLFALAGAWSASRLDAARLEPIVGLVFIVWALVLLLRPGRFLHPPEQPRDPGIGAYVAAAGIGFYGGFLQAGVGFPLLALLVSGLGYAPVRANAIKIVFVFVFTALALPVFVLADAVAWSEGISLAVGSFVGGWVGTRWQLHAGAGIVRWFVLLAVAGSGVAMVLRLL